MHLRRQMLTLRFDGGSLQQHFLRFDKLIREYRATGADLEELDVVCHLLLTLGSLYSTVVTALETMAEEHLSLEFVKCRLLDEETKQKGIELCTSRKEETAFAGSKQHFKKKKKKCYNCKQGHKMSECPQKREKNVERPKSRAHLAEKSDVCFVGVSGGNSVPDNRVSWYIDSGYLANDKSLFDELKPLPCPVEIAIAKNDEFIVAKHSGTVTVISKVNGKDIQCSIENVRYVPELRCNLFSVMRVDEAGMRVTYLNGEVNIHRGSQLVACGRRVGKLYQTL